MAESFKVRALEIHDTFQMWSVEKMQRVFEFMLRNNMNTLVFHENNSQDSCMAMRARTSEAIPSTGQTCTGRYTTGLRAHMSSQMS